MERMTMANLHDRVGNLNRRMKDSKARYRYVVFRRNGHIALDRVDRVDDKYWSIVSTVTVGTKREVGDFLHAMMVALDDVLISA